MLIDIIVVYSGRLLGLTEDQIMDHFRTYKQNKSLIIYTLEIFHERHCINRLVGGAFTRWNGLEVYLPLVDQDHTTLS